MGYAFVDSRVSGGQLVEYDTTACKHCSAAIKIVKRKAQSGAYCTHCHGPVCNRPPCATSCRPTVLKIDAFKRAIERRRSSDRFAMAAGLQR